MNEEKEAIDYLKNDVVYWLDKGKDFVVVDIGENEKLHSILNLINEQQKEITKLSEKVTNNICANVENEVLEEYRQKIKEQQKEIEEKNVAINKMSKDISRQLKEIEKLNFENHMTKKWNEQLDKNYISKDKIREKIEEIKTKKIGASTGIYAIQIDILEELLEEK